MTAPAEQQVEVIDRRIGDWAGGDAVLQLAQFEIPPHVLVGQVEDHRGAIDPLRNAAAPDGDIGVPHSPIAQARGIECIAGADEQQRRGTAFVVVVVAVERRFPKRQI